MPTSKVAKKPNKAETNLDEAMRAFLGEGPEAHSPQEWLGLCNLLKLQALYPGQFVAWRDHYEGEDDERRLVFREILFASKRGADVRRKLAKLSDEELYGVFMGYVPAPDEIPFLH